MVKSSSFEGEKYRFESGAGIQFRRHKMTAPIDRLRPVPVPGKEGAYVLVDKETGEEFNVPDLIMAMYAAGQCKGK